MELGNATNGIGAWRRLGYDGNGYGEGFEG